MTVQVGVIQAQQPSQKPQATSRPASPRPPKTLTPTMSEKCGTVVSASKAAEKSRWRSGTGDEQWGALGRGEDKRD